MKDLNRELSQKLEVQTQRLELLTSQSMVSDNIPQRKSPPRPVMDNTPYADEGDEVHRRCPITNILLQPDVAILTHLHMVSSGYG